MKTLRAIEHLKFRMQSSKMTVGKKEQEAINQIIDHYNSSRKRHQKDNKMLIKMIMHDFIYKSAYRKIGAKNALKAINDKLSIPLEEYYTKFIEDAKLERYSKLLEDSGYKDIYKMNRADWDDQEKRNLEIIKQNQERLEYLLLKGYTREQMVRFLRNDVYDMILDNQDKP